MSGECPHRFAEYCPCALANAYARGRAEAIEECAKVAIGHVAACSSCRKTLAHAIRALASEGGGTDETND